MMPASPSGDDALATDLQNHDFAGQEILASEPSRLIRLTILVVFALLVSALVWSFLGKADVIVTAPGRLAPEGALRRLFVPVDGEIVANFMVEGAPVARGDVLIRIDSPDAVRLAVQAESSRLALKAAQQRADLLPDRERDMQDRLRLLRSEIAAAQQQQDRRIEQGGASLGDQQGSRLSDLKLRLMELKAQIEQDRADTETGLLLARASARAAGPITLDDLDDDRVLVVRAPVGGVLTDVALHREGVSVDARQPLSGIAPADARVLIELEIAEKHHASLHEGMPIRVKLDAFPFQRYGSIEGTLEFVAPGPGPSARDPRLTVYRARARLDRDFIDTGAARYPLQYGMLGIGEIVVGKRRLIELAFDPLDGAAG